MKAPGDPNPWTFKCDFLGYKISPLVTFKNLYRYALGRISRHSNFNVLISIRIDKYMSLDMVGLGRTSVCIQLTDSAQP